jgi:phosphonate transport system ATP-binding protein
MAMLADINRRDGVTVVVSLHQVDFALQYCRRVVALREGRVFMDGPVEDCTVERLEGVYGSDVVAHELGTAPSPRPGGHVEHRRTECTREAEAR